MSSTYRLFGAETSPYSVKVRSFLRYKRLPHEWVVRSMATESEFAGLARTPALPLLVSANGAVAQDSTAIIKALEAAHKDRPIIPEDPICAFLAEIFEDYADEWLNKAMFHYRWSKPENSVPAAERQLDQMLGSYDHKDRKSAETQIAKSMSERLPLVGSTKTTAAAIEASFERFVSLLNRHLEDHLYLFGGCPSIGDFGLAGQLIQLMSDPTPGAFIRDKAPFVMAWCEFMEDPRAGAPFEPFEDLKETLLPILKDEVAATYLTWASANNASIAKKRKTLDPMIDGKKFRQNVQKHADLSFKQIKDQALALKEHDGFASILEEADLKSDLLAE